MVRKEAIVGNVKSNMVFFLPILSLRWSVNKGPAATPKDNIPAIRDSCWGVSGCGSGLASGSTVPFNFGMTGEANAKAMPAVNAIRLSVVNESVD